MMHFPYLHHLVVPHLVQFGWNPHRFPYSSSGPSRGDYRILGVVSHVSRGSLTNWYAPDSFSKSGPSRAPYFASFSRPRLGWEAP
jgi:hypothetical protein